MTFAFFPSLFAHVLAVMHECDEHVACSIFTRYRRQNKNKSNVRMQQSAPSLAHVVHDVDPGFAMNAADPHVTCVLFPSLFAHVLAVMDVCDEHAALANGTRSKTPSKHV